jgi:MoxR-like ATPase
LYPLAAPGNRANRKILVSFMPTTAEYGAVSGETVSGETALPLSVSPLYSNLALQRGVGSSLGAFMSKSDGGKPDVAATAQKILANIEKVIIGKRPQITLALVAYLCEGHILLEDVPGVAKTMLARALARSVGCTFKRVQCTPDLLPTDVTGVSVFNQKTAEFEFRPGPIFAQTVLADEINRATPRTQAALLEAMAERRVTVDGQGYVLKPPFLVIATQNPIDHEGTFPLPEAQLDRFLIRLSIGYPSLEEEAKMLQRLQLSHPIDDLPAVATAAEIVGCQEAIREIHVDDKVRKYLLQIVHATREHNDVHLGGSPRASIALFRTAQALAAVNGRNFVLPDDVKRMMMPVLGHRLIIKPESRLRKVTPAAIVNDVLGEVPVPVPGMRGARAEEEEAVWQ